MTSSAPRGTTKIVRASANANGRFSTVTGVEPGPVLVVYPDNVWYTFVDKEDIDDIIDNHLVHGRIVERLRLPEDAA